MCIRDSISAVARAEIDRSGGGINGSHHRPLGGDQSAARAGNEGDDIVAHPVGVAAGADELGARQAAR